jgi:hypothetical protein
VERASCGQRDSGQPLPAGWYWYVGTVTIGSGTWTRVNALYPTTPFAYLARGK